MNILFFGSTSDSVIVLETLTQYTISAVITQPPTPIGRKQIVTPTPVEVWAKNHHIPVCSFPAHKDKPWLYEHEEKVVNTLSTFKPDLLVSACYGQKIPNQTIAETKFGGLNIHPSLLPRWRGADPIPWTMLSGDKQTGVTVVTITDTFDQGEIIAQKKINITDTDIPDPLRTKLFREGADLLITSLPEYISGKNKGIDQKPELATYARKLTRQDGFIPWEHIEKALTGNDVQRENRIGISQLVLCPMPCVIIRMIRALSPWPGVWTTIAISYQPSARPPTRQARLQKRLKILGAHMEKEKLVLDTVQLEGKNPIQWKQFEKSYIVR